MNWTVDGRSFALTVGHADHVGLWVGSVEGDVTRIDGVALNPLLGTALNWLPDQKRLLVLLIPGRGPAPEAPAIPVGPEIVEGAGAAAARSTYEARNLLQTAHDDALFEYYATSAIGIVDPQTGKATVLGEAAPYFTAEVSPDGNYLLVERLVGLWSHEVAWWRFAREIEVWNLKGQRVATVASVPLADEVPTQGVAKGPRSVSWRATAAHTLYWIEALDGGDPVAEVPHRDRLMRLAEPFDGDPEEVFRAEHRISSWQMAWGAEGGTLMLGQRERIRRWRYVWLLDVDKGTSRPWFDLDEDDRYGDPGYPLFRPLPNGRWVFHQKGDAVYFSGSGATEQGDRPFLDLRSMETGKAERLFRCDPDRFEYFVAFAGGDDRFVMRSESAVDVPNYYLGTLGKRIEASEGEAARAISRVPITRFEDPTPQLREIEKRLVRYEREDGVALSFQLQLPPGYEEGTRLPTVLYAYPLEYSGATDRRTGERLGSALQPFPGSVPPLLPAPWLRRARPHRDADDRRSRDHLRHLRTPAGGRRGSRGGQGRGDRRGRPRADRHHRPQPRRTDGRQPPGAHRPVPGGHRPQRVVQQDQPALRLPVRATVPLRSQGCLHRALAHLLRRPGQRTGPGHPWQRRLQPGHAHLPVGGFLRGRTRLGRHRSDGAAALRGPRLPSTGERGTRALGTAPMV